MSLLDRANRFAERFGLRAPILLAPMAGVPAPALSIAVVEAGGMGACGALLMQPAEIAAWVATVRAASRAPIQLNLWIPDPPPPRDARHESLVADFLSGWGPAVAAGAGDSTLPDFEMQCNTLLELGPTVISSVMGLYPPAYVSRMKERGIAWFAVATTVAEAKAAESAGADVIIAQGAEAGGHRGSFDGRLAESTQVGLFALLPAIVDAVRVPVVATGGVADARGVAAALMLGASAVQIGTGFLRSPEAAIPPAWADALATTQPEDTIVSRVFSGRPGRSIATSYVRAATSDTAPEPAPYPVQRGLTAAMRRDANARGDLERMQAWAGQRAALAKAEPAADIVRALWADAVSLLDARASSSR